MISEKKYSELIKFNEKRLYSIKSLMVLDLKKAGYIEESGKRTKEGNDTLSTFRLTEFAKSAMAKYEASLQETETVIPTTVTITEADAWATLEVLNRVCDELNAKQDFDEADRISKFAVRIRAALANPAPVKETV